MTLLEHIAHALNEAVREAIPCEANMLLLAYPVKRVRKGGKEVVEPVIPAADGECTPASFEDGFDMVAYHRPISIATQRLPGGYGDGIGKIKMTNRMSMVIWSQRSKTGVSTDDLAFRLHLAIPDQLELRMSPHIISATINITDVVLNTEQVFNEEFKNVDYFILPEHSLLKANYTIESILDKRCFNTLCGQSAAKANR